jgi:hypothetical protein
MLSEALDAVLSGGGNGSGLTRASKAREVPVEGLKVDRVMFEFRRHRKTSEKGCRSGKPTVLVLLNGSAVAVNWAKDNVPAIVDAWYPGQAGGTAIADVLFGDYNPAGRLPVTFYKSADQIPPFTDYAMKGKTYRFFTGEPLFKFGYGLSYTTFIYGNMVVPKQVKIGDSVKLSVDITNAGSRDGEEVVQLYVTGRGTPGEPIRSLEGFQRIALKKNQTKTVEFTLKPEQLSHVLANGRRVPMPVRLRFPWRPAAIPSVTNVATATFQPSKKGPDPSGPFVQGLVDVVAGGEMADSSHGFDNPTSRTAALHTSITDENLPCPPAPGARRRTRSLLRFPARRLEG